MELGETMEGITSDPMAVTGQIDGGDVEYPDLQPWVPQEAAQGGQRGAQAGVRGHAQGYGQDVPYHGAEAVSRVKQSVQQRKDEERAAHEERLARARREMFAERKMMAAKLRAGMAH